MRQEEQVETKEMFIIMPDNNKTNEFLQKLAPCIDRRELEKCVE